MRIATYNLNGIRSAINKGFLTWLEGCNPDVICIQELKMHEPEGIKTMLEDKGYHVYWHGAEKKGYSGVAIFSKVKPKDVVVGCGEAKFDMEGRVLRADYDEFSVMSLYMPSGTSGDERQAVKYEMMDYFFDYIHGIRQAVPPMFICGDYNICHKPIDIHNPKSNAKTSGFLPEERAWLDTFINSGYKDTFRAFNEEPHQYTWWSQRSNAREKNLGWRIDYILSDERLSSTWQRCAILPEAKHSDHCPQILDISSNT